MVARTWRRGVVALTAACLAMSATAAIGPTVAAAPPTGLALSITDSPFSVGPNTLDLGSYSVRPTATETVTLTNDTGRGVSVEVSGDTGVSVTGIAGCGGFLPPDNVVASLYLDIGLTCDIDMTIDASTVGPVGGQLTFTDIDSSLTASVAVSAEVVPPVPPANDNWVDAQDLSSLAIPAFVGVPGTFPGTQQPRDTEFVNGSTEFASYEPGELFSRPGGSVWYRYTSPPGGFSGRLGYRATPGFFVDVTTGNTSAVESRVARGNSWPPSGIQFVRMEPGHTVWFRVFNESVDPGPFTLELFQGPNEQDSIDQAYDGTGAGETALSTDFNLFGDGDTHHLTADLAGAPNGWFTLRFAVSGSLSVTYRSATAVSLDQAGTNEGSERPLGLRIYRSPQAARVNDPAVLGAPIAVGSGAIGNAPAPAILGPRWETSATVPVTPGRYYWTFEEAAGGPTFFITQWRFTAAGGGDTEPPTATIVTPPDGARYALGAVPATVVSTCTDNQGPATSFVTVDGVETTSLATSPGSHTVSLECTDSAGNMSSASATYTVVAPDTTPPTITITGIASGELVTRASPVVTISSDEPLFASLCTLETPTAGGGSVINDIGCLADGSSLDTLALADLGDGTVTFTVSGVDAAGNRGQVSVTFLVEVAPVVTITAPADGSVLFPIDVPETVQYTCSDNSGIVLPDVEIQLVLAGGPVLLTGAPPSTVGTHTIRVLCFDGDNNEGVGEVTYTVVTDTRGPCVLVDTQVVDFGNVAFGTTSAARPVVVRSCSAAPIRLAVSVSNATGGGAQAWLLSTSTVPAAGEFAWRVAPAGGSAPIRVGPIPTSVGPSLAAGASRTDDHILTLGTTGPGPGTRFTTTITYTATVGR